MKHFQTWIFGFTAVLISINCWGWGKIGHEVVETTAARLMPRSSFAQLIKANDDSVKYLAMVPDMFWKHGPTPHPLEGQMHFFTFDFYGKGNQPIPKDIQELVKKFGKENVLKYGTAPWRMDQMSQLLYQALSKSRTSLKTVLQIAATQGHYVGDLGNPLHVNSDYDGEKIGVPGLHSYFEATTLEHINRKELEQAVFAAGQAWLAKIPENITPIDGAFLMAAYANSQVDTLKSMAKRYKLTPQFQRAATPMIIRTLGVSAAVLSRIWYAAWVGAGKPDMNPDNVGRIPVPDWVPPNYIQ